jgi:1-acyl-sn-glycerol-3-phosphate acyltransferase
VRYVDRHGRLHPAADFIGDMTFAQSLLTILKAPGMTAQLTLLPAIDTGAASHRRELADAAYTSIATALDETVAEPGRIASRSN